MSVVTTVEYVTDGRIYEGLPQGIEPWHASGLALGNGSGGDQGIRINFNPGSPRTFQPYVSVCHIGITTQTQDAVDNFMAVINGNDWEKAIQSPSPGSLPFANITMNDNQVGQVGVWNEVFYCGRVQLGTDGTMSIRATEVNSSTMNIFVSGFIADRPFITHNDWRV